MNLTYTFLPNSWVPYGDIQFVCLAARSLRHTEVELSITSSVRVCTEQDLVCLV